MGPNRLLQRLAGLVHRSGHWQLAYTPATPITMSVQTCPGVQILGPVSPLHADILSLEAQSFVAALNRCFNARRKELLARRDTRQVEIDRGVLPDFLPETRGMASSFNRLKCSDAVERQMPHKSTHTR
jgi:malate synthase